MLTTVVSSHGVLDLRGVDEAFAVDGEDGGFPAFAFELFDGVEHGVVLDGAGDDVAAGVLAGLGRAADGEVVGFGAAGGEDDLAGLAFEQVGDGLAGVVEQGAGTLRFLVDAAGIAPAVAQDGRHRVEDAGVERGGGGVVEVVAFHRADPNCYACGTRRRGANRWSSS